MSHINIANKTLQFLHLGNEELGPVIPRIYFKSRVQNLSNWKVTVRAMIQRKEYQSEKEEIHWIKFQLYNKQEAQS